MRDLPPVRVDVLIIGQGAAGLLAGISLGRDHSVAVVGDRASATSLSTGCISVISQEAETISGGRIDLESLAHSVHPFSDIIDRSAMSLETLLPEMSETFFRAMADQGLEMSDDLFHQYPLLTNVGTEYSCSSAPIHTISGQLDRMAGSKLAVLGIDGGMDMDADLVPLLFDRERWRMRISSHWASIEGLKGRRNCNPGEIAEAFRSEEALEQLIEAIKDLDEENVMIPPLVPALHLFQSDDRLEAEDRPQRVRGGHPAFIAWAPAPEQRWKGQRRARRMPVVERAHRREAADRGRHRHRGGPEHPDQAQDLPFQLDNHRHRGRDRRRPGDQGEEDSRPLRLPEGGDLPFAIRAGVTAHSGGGGGDRLPGRQRHAPDIQGGQAPCGTPSGPVRHWPASPSPPASGWAARC